MNDNWMPYKGRERLAYHEAGHAAMYWMFGEGHEIKNIGMKPDKESLARVVPNKSVHYTMALNLSYGPYRRIAAKKEIMISLGGPAAEIKYRNSIGYKYSTSYWLEDAETEEEFENPTHDACHAMTMAKACGSGMPMLHRMANWTDEAMEHPIIWNAIEALAKELIKTKVQMSGKRAYRIMESTWSGGFPELEMGYKWKRRFTTSCVPDIVDDDEGGEV